MSKKVPVPTFIVGHTDRNVGYRAQDLHTKYVNALRRELLSRLKNDWVVSSSFYDAAQGGGLVHFRIAPGLQIQDPAPRNVPTMAQALESVLASEVRGQLDASVREKIETFKRHLRDRTTPGTDVLLIGDSIILAKSDENPQLWDEEASKKDAARIIAATR